MITPLGGRKVPRGRMLSQMIPRIQQSYDNRAKTQYGFNNLL